MKCNKCGSLNVVSKIVIQNDKVNEEINLCPSCLQSFVKEHPEIRNGPAGKSINEFLLNAINYLNSGLKSFNETENITASDTKICPVCSTPAMLVKRERVAGCPNCYQFFKKEINDFLFTSTGKHYSADDQIEMSKAQKSESLNNKIKEAVKSENYEIAATLRDELKKIK